MGSKFSFFLQSNTNCLQGHQASILIGHIVDYKSRPELSTTQKERAPQTTPDLKSAVLQHNNFQAFPSCNKNAPPFRAIA